MTLTRKHFKKEKKVKVNGQNQGRARKFLSKISGAFMLPISVMAIAGIFLGIGAIITAQIPAADQATSALFKFGNFIKMLGDPIFGAMPILFATAIVIAFTEEAGVAVFATIIGFLIFNSLQMVFITPVTTPNGQEGFIVLFQGWGRDPILLKNLVGFNLGILSLQTSIFGGIIVGAISAWLYNHFHTIQLPQVISFFGGKRFVAFLVILAMIPLSFVFLLIWPYIGQGLSIFGESLGKAPLGTESLIFGIIERSLIPFGLHHVFYAPLWYSSAGGDGLKSLENWINAHPGITGGNINELLIYLQNNKNRAVGDSFLWLTLNGFSSNKINWTIGGNNIELSVFDFFAQELEIKLGRFMQGKYPFMIFGLPAAGFAMILAAPKENRKIAMGTVFPAIFTALLTGITEPIEFTFLFLAPWLYWGFHAIMAGIAFWLMNIAGAHVGMTVSGGLLDLIIYGAIPIMKGTHFWWTLIVGPGFIPIYFIVFFLCIKRFDLSTPGRGGNVTLFKRADYVQAKNNNNKTNQENLNPQISAIVSAFGGWDNIKTYNNCASRLRYDVLDSNKVNIEALKSAGAFGVQKVGESHFQAIFGPVSEQLNSKIVASKGQPLLNQFPNQKQDQTKKNQIVNKQKTIIHGIIDGQIIQLKELKDGVFSEKLMGDGVAIIPKISKNAIFHSPLDGKLTTVFPTGHAYGIQTKDGVSILIHIGIDTVNLKGKGFKTLVKQGDEIKQGEPLVEVDLEYVNNNAPSIATIIVATPDTNGEIKILKTNGLVNQKTQLFEVN